MLKHKAKHAPRKDAEIVQDIQQSLRLDDDVPEIGITVEVSHGVVTLRGEVDNSFQKEAAESDARKIKGVRAVTNRIHI